MAIKKKIERLTTIDPQIVKWADKYGFNAPHGVAGEEHTEITVLLIQRGADVNASRIEPHTVVFPIVVAAGRLHLARPRMMSFKTQLVVTRVIKRPFFRTLTAKSGPCLRRVVLLCRKLVCWQVFGTSRHRSVLW